MHNSESTNIRLPGKFKSNYLFALIKKKGTLDLQVNYLLALSHLLQNIPAQVVTNEISKVKTK